MYKFAYISGVFLLAPLFILIFATRKDLRTEMIFNGFIGGIIAFCSAQYFLGIYWTPITLFDLKNSVEDFLFGFFLCSESAVVFNYMFKKYYKSFSFSNHLKDNLVKIILTIISAPLLFLLLERIISLNPIYTSMISFLIPIIAMVTFNKALLSVCLFTGFFISIYTILFYLAFTSLYPGIITSWWNIDGISSILLMGIPLEEILWFSLVGMLCSVSYKFTFGTKFRA